MKCVILAGGRGTRIFELTKEIPKPMIKIFGKPILYYIILWNITLIMASRNLL